MTTNIIAPTMGESISEATVASWSVKEGDYVEADQLIAELETDKVNLEVVAPAAGVIGKIVAAAGATVAPGDVMGEVDESASKPAASASSSAQTPAAPAPAAQPATASNTSAMPAAKAAAAEKGVDVNTLAGSGKDGRVLKEDVLKAVAKPGLKPHKTLRRCSPPITKLTSLPLWPCARNIRMLSKSSTAQNWGL